MTTTTTNFDLSEYHQNQTKRVILSFESQPGLDANFTEANSETIMVHAGDRSVYKYINSGATQFDCRLVATVASSHRSPAEL
jgi:hypothetical protein